MCVKDHHGLFHKIQDTLHIKTFTKVGDLDTELQSVFPSRSQSGDRKTASCMPIHTRENGKLKVSQYILT